MSARYSSKKFASLEFNIKISIHNSDLAVFIGALLAILEPKTHIIAVHTTTDEYIIKYGAVIKEFNAMPESFENYLDQKNRLHFEVRIKNYNGSHFIPEKINRCKEVGWMD